LLFDVMPKIFFIASDIGGLSKAGTHALQTWQSGKASWRRQAAPIGACYALAEPTYVV
jgi:hypothetical protein